MWISFNILFISHGTNYEEWELSEFNYFPSSKIHVPVNLDLQVHFNRACRFWSWDSEACHNSWSLSLFFTIASIYRIFPFISSSMLWWRISRLVSLLPKREIERHCASVIDSSQSSHDIIGLHVYAFLRGHTLTSILYISISRNMESCIIDLLETWF